MASADNYAPFYVFDSTIQQPFTNGMTATVSSAMSTIQGPLTAVVVLWIIVTGISVMRGDVGVRNGVTRIIRITLVVGILMSATLYNEYVVLFFTQGLPNWLASSFLGVTGVQPSAHQFDALWNSADELIRTAQQNLNFYNVFYSVELALCQDFVIVPIGVTFLIYETAKIMMDIIVAIGPFVIAGYLFEATRSIADRWVGKLIGLSLLTLLIDIILSIILNGDQAYFNVSMTNLSLATILDTITIVIQFLGFLTLGSLISCFLPAVASYIGGGISVSPLIMASSAMQVGRIASSIRSKPQTAESKRS
jgi:type IV secretion system protein VirB6